MFRRLLNIIGVVMVIAMTVFSFYCYAQQQRSLEWMGTYTADQQKNIQELKVGIKDLKNGLEEQRVKFEKVQKENAQIGELIPQIKDSIVEIKSVISQSRAEAWKIKDDTKEWQKDYVSTLVSIQQKVDALEVSLNSTSEIVDQGLPKILDEIDAIKNDIRRIKEKNPEKSAGGVLIEPLPRFDPRLP
jgi:uncharacterized phage infection (PIP) family protein YhgE